ncbi:hypothetical protein [uncultured Treponema sp.]|uniref:hypothetical protein n=1 Tax=uncultured Treponema sp. TaxID=162155 RepID=UPI002614D896|nr:hypothetical protein [uncultured Treponema sp.]
MKYAYDEMYLADVEKNLGFFFQFLLHNLNLSPLEAQNLFLKSEIPGQIEIANPNFLCGKSGYELAMIAIPKTDLSAKIAEAIKAPFYPEAEYWAGFVLAYCQWKNAVSFAKILNSYPLENILASYHLLHEADVSKAEEIIMEKICS